MITMTLSEAATILGGELVGPDKEIRGVSTDTRKAQVGELFVALRGPKFDGHDCLEDARYKEVSGTVVDRYVDTKLTYIKVPETRLALGKLAKFWRSKFSIPVAAITGSVGKTTVKEMLGQIANGSGNALVTRGNFNNEVGVPLTLFHMRKDHDFAVLEMGASKRGDIRILSEIACPSVSVITLCAAAHLEGFRDLETVARTKGEIIEGLPRTGIAVINTDDRFFAMWKEMAGSREIVTFGTNGSVQAVLRPKEKRKLAIQLKTPVGSREVQIRHVGNHNVMNAAAATAAGLALGIELDAIVRGLHESRSAPRRMEIKQGPEGYRLVDDTYNANPASTLAAIRYLGAEAGSRWFVFGDMGELGDMAAEFHYRVGRAANDADIARLFTVGTLSEEAHSSYKGISEHYSKNEALISRLKDLTSENLGSVTILFKGSRAMGLEKVVDSLSGEGSKKC
jgi:UDP-N-acetylmuramoyl-tripeptide--D-alanyl-D-alanine ligase